MSKSVAFVDGEKWGDSKAKKLLTLQIVQGQVGKGSKPKDVHQSNAEYLKWPLHQFGCNMRNLLKSHSEGKLGGKSDMTIKSILRGGGDGGVDEMSQTLKSLGLLSVADGDDVGIPDDKTVFDRNGPPLSIKINKKPSIYRMTLPFIQFPWDDEFGRSRLTIIIHLPSGSYRTGIFSYKIMGIRKKFYLYMDMTEYRVMDPGKYGKAFKDSTKQPLFSAEDTKMASYRRHIREKKGSSSQNKVKAVMEIPLDIQVKGKVTNAEGYSGFLILPFGEQLFLQIELMGLPDGHDGNQINKRTKKAEEYCDSDEEMKE